MAEPRYKVVNGEYIELTAEEIKELEDMRAAADLNFDHVRNDRNGILLQQQRKQPRKQQRQPNN